MANEVFDLVGLKAAVRIRIEQQNLTLREAAIQCGLSSSTMSRMWRKDLAEGCEADTFTRLANWLGRSPAEFIRKDETVSVPTGDTLGAIERLINSDPTLTPDARVDLMELMSIAYLRLAKRQKPVETVAPNLSGTICKIPHLR